jgi:hypothetical protein
LVSWVESVENIPGAITKPRIRGEWDTPKRRTRVCVRTLSPGYVVGPKAHRFARGESLADSAGSQRVRVIVVESLGSRHRTNVSVVLVRRGVARRNVARGA